MAEEAARCLFHSYKTGPWVQAPEMDALWAGMSQEEKQFWIDKLIRSYEDNEEPPSWAHDLPPSYEEGERLREAAIGGEWYRDPDS